MTNDSLGESSDAILGHVMDEFMEAVRLGKTPPLSEYVERYPELEDDIRDLLPMVAMVEHSPPTDNPAARDPTTSIPEELGGYRIISEIGRGGMGVVYRARHLTLGREVALKVLPKSSIPDAGSEERFRREAKAAALLHHTNIVPVFEVGRDEEIHFYAMQYIHGLTVDRLQDELHRVRSGELELQHCAPETGVLLGVRERMPESTIGQSPGRATETLATGRSTSLQSCFRGIAEIGIQVADALQYAHARGIIHRDVKPANLLIDAAGVVWLTDFGLAKTEDDGFTRTGQFVGTLRYMSPERFSGRCDATSDIYSLGATLYELLALRPAFEARDRLQLIEQIANADPKPLREIDQRIPVDLETIVMKALEKEPQRRYQTAAELMEELRRFRDGEPILSRSATRLERAVKWARRRPAVAGLMALVFLVGTLGFSFSTWQWMRAARERDDRAIAQTRAEESLQRARDAVSAMLTQVGDKRLRNIPHMETLRQQLLEEAIRFNRSLVSISNDPDVRADTGEAHLMLADIYLMLGRTEAARQSFHDALTTFEDLHEDEPQSSEYAHRLAAAYTTAAAGFLEIQQPATARRFCEKALQGLADASTEERSETLARTHFTFARLESDAGNSVSAEDHYRATITALASLSGNTARLKHLRVRADSGLGEILSRTGRIPEAEVVLERMLSACIELVDRHPQERIFQEALADAYRQVGTFRKATNDRVAGRQHVEQSLAVQRKLAADFPHIPDYRKQVSSSLALLAISYAEGGNNTEAERLFTEARDEARQLSDDFPQVVDFLHLRHRTERVLGIFFYNSRQVPRAITALTASAADLEKFAAEYPANPYYRLEIALALHTLGHAHRANGSPDDGIRAIRRELEIEEALRIELPDDIKIRHKITQAHRAFGELYRAKEDYEAAESSFLTAIANQREVVAAVPERSEHHRHLTHAIENLASLYHEDLNDRQADAEALYMEAIGLKREIIRNDPNWYNPQVELADVLQRFGELHEQRQRHKSADEAFQESLDIYRRLFVDRKDDANLLLSLVAVTQSQARSKMRTKEWPEMIGLLKESVEFLGAAQELRPGDDGIRAQLAEPLLKLATGCLKVNRTREALAALDRVRDLTNRSKSIVTNTAATYVALSQHAGVDQVMRAQALACALEELALAQKTTWKQNEKPSKLSDDKRFDPVRSMPKFEKLLTDKAASDSESL